ncbi:MAG: hypothetical protein CMC33_01630 [Flavobacteriaceae bacterium]|nr:hypothetical protein [Flavobacteriaceae bacterium]
MKEKINNFIIDFYLNKHHSLKSNNDFFKLKLRIYSCQEKRSKMYVIKNIVLTLNDWKEINDDKLLNKTNLEKKALITNYKNLAINVCLRDEVKLIKDFDLVWKNPSNLSLNVYQVLEKKQNDVLTTNGISYSNDFKYLSHHLKFFCYKIDIDRNNLNRKNSLNFKSNLKKNLSFYDITINFLNQFEKFLTSIPNKKLYPLIKRNQIISIGSLSKYLRAFRVCFNEMIYKYKLLNSSTYPFSRKLDDGGYRIKTPINSKSNVLSDIDLRLLLSYDTKNKRYKRAHDFWVFSFYAKGMNMNDIARLKWKDIDEINGNKFFTFYRGIKKSENQPKIKVNISNLMWFIIKRNRGNEKYLFDIIKELNPNKNEIEIYKNKESRFCNKYLKFIQNELGIFENEQLMMSTARHTAAYTALKGGLNPLDVGKHLGNIDNRSIYAYTKSLIQTPGKSQDDDMQQMLLDKSKKIVRDKNGNLVIIDI